MHRFSTVPIAATSAITFTAIASAVDIPVKVPRRAIAPVGGGIEYALNPYVGTGIEYNFVRINIGDRDQCVSPGFVTPETVTGAPTDIQTVWVG